MKVLVVGGSGKVGSMTVPHLAAAEQISGVTVFDRKPPRRDVPGTGFVEGDVADHAALRAALDGHDALVFMAMGPESADWGSPENAALHFDVAAKGLYLALAAAHDAGIRRVVYTSSMSVYGSDMSVYVNADSTELSGHPPLPAEDVPPAGTDFYAVAKRVGELVLEAQCRELGMTGVALRLCFPTADEEWPPRTSRVLRRTMATSGRDTARAVLAGLGHTPADGAFAAFGISGDATGRLVDISRAGKELGWRPVDPAPEV